jgi:Crinkler effector protein N-terminal domain
MTIIGSDDKFKFRCWILNKSDRYFSVEIGMSKEVEDLKKKIKEMKDI